MSVSLERSDFLTSLETWPEMGRDHRVVRNDDRVEDLAVLTEDLIRQAILDGRDEDAVALLDYLFEESQLTIEHIHETAAAIWTLVQERHGEDMLGRVIMENFEMDEWAKQHQNLSHKKSAPMTMQEYTQFHEGEHKRGLHYNTAVHEEPDRFVVRFDPCGNGQRMRRKGKDGGLPAYLGATQEAHPWSFGQAGVPLWCCRCSASEFRKLGTRGYMTMVTDYNPDGTAPCMRYLYKDPADIPEKFFHRGGYQKKPELFRIIGQAPAMNPEENARLKLEAGNDPGASGAKR